MNSKLMFDLHTHTVYSHGSGSILDNARAASKKGLKCLGIADHGPGHRFYGMKMADHAAMRSDILLAKKQFPNLDIKLSVEANIVNPSGHLDVSTEEQQIFDFIVAGYHFGAFGEEPVKAFQMMVGGYLYSACGAASVRARNRNTDIIVKALTENNIKILSHPGCKIAVDIEEIARACEYTGTWMEINNKHGHLDVPEIEKAAKYDVKFVLSSDAHSPEAVGVVDKALERAFAAGLPIERIVNLCEDLPVRRPRRMKRRKMRKVQ